MHLEEARGLPVVMLHVHDAKQECGSAQLVIMCVFILLFGVVVIVLWYTAVPQWLPARFHIPAEANALPHEGASALYTDFYTCCAPSM